jgi:hypothetical protein
MRGCTQTSRSIKVRIKPEPFCSCLSNSCDIGSKLSCFCGEELAGRYVWVWVSVLIQRKDVDVYRHYVQGVWKITVRFLEPVFRRMRNIFKKTIFYLKCISVLNVIGEFPHSSLLIALDMSTSWYTPCSWSVVACSVTSLNLTFKLFGPWILSLWT